MQNKVRVGLGLCYFHRVCETADRSYSISEQEAIEFAERFIRAVPNGGRTVVGSDVGSDRPTNLPKKSFPTVFLVGRHPTYLFLVVF